MVTERVYVKTIKLRDSCHGLRRLSCLFQFHVERREKGREKRQMRTDGTVLAILSEKMHAIAFSDACSRSWKINGTIMLERKLSSKQKRNRIGLLLKISDRDE